MSKRKLSYFLNSSNTVRCRLLSKGHFGPDFHTNWIFDIWGENNTNNIYTSQNHAECQNMPHSQLSLTCNFYSFIFLTQTMGTQKDKRQIWKQSLAVIDPFLMQTGRWSVILFLFVGPVGCLCEIDKGLLSWLIAKKRR